MAVEPVAETSGMRVVVGELHGAVGAAEHELEEAVGDVAEPLGGATRGATVVAIAVSGVRSEGFQITGSPQTSASAAFQPRPRRGS